MYFLPMKKTTLVTNVNLATWAWIQRSIWCLSTRMWTRKSSTVIWGICIVPFGLLQGGGFPIEYKGKYQILISCTLIQTSGIHCGDEII